MATSGEQRIRDLTARMLRKTLFVILSKGHASADELGDALPDHLEYMIGLERDGTLFASGPLSTKPGEPVGDGLTVIRARDAEAARAIASADPFVLKGLRSFTLREWTVMEGSIGLQVNFSDQTIQVT